MIPVERRPFCRDCKRHAVDNWNGRLPGAAGGWRIVHARYWVRRRGTEGLMTHLCEACQERTGDHIEFDFEAP